MSNTSFLEDDLDDLTYTCGIPEHGCCNCDVDIEGHGGPASLHTKPVLNMRFVGLALRGWAADAEQPVLTSFDLGCLLKRTARYMDAYHYDPELRSLIDACEGLVEKKSRAAVSETAVAPQEFQADLLKLMAHPTMSIKQLCRMYGEDEQAIVRQLGFKGVHYDRVLDAERQLRGEFESFAKIAKSTGLDSDAVEKLGQAMHAKPRPRKNRSATGTDAFTPEQINEILERHKAGETSRQIGAAYGVSHVTVQRAIRKAVAA